VKKFWSALAIVFVLLPFATVSADSVSISQQIHLTGIVPPMRFIVVNGQGAITEITSNTPENVTPKVMLGSLQGAELPLTPELLKEFATKTKGVDMHSTDLHFAPRGLAAARSKHPALSAVRPISLLRLSP